MPKIISGFAVDKPCYNWARLSVISLFSNTVNCMEFDFVRTLQCFNILLTFSLLLSNTFGTSYNKKEIIFSVVTVEEKAALK